MGREGNSKEEEDGKINIKDFEKFLRFTGFMTDGIIVAKIKEFVFKTIDRMDQS